MSKMQDLLKAKLAENIEKHSAAEKKFDGFDIYQGSRLETIPIDDIQANPAQPRTEFNESDLQDLASSIEKNGLLQPITVRKVNNSYHIVAGERRFRAHKLLNKKSIDCLVVNIADEQNALLALAENLSRADLSDYETALAVNKIKDTFASKTELAKALGISRAKLYKLFSFDELPNGFLQRLHATPSMISADTAEQIKTLKKELNLSSDDLDELLSHAIQPLISGELKQSHLYDFIISQISSKDNVNHQANGNTKSSSASNNVRKTYVKDGINIGKIKSDNKKFIVELSTESLTGDQESKLISFIDILLE